MKEVEGFTERVNALTVNVLRENKVKIFFGPKMLFSAR